MLIVNPLSGNGKAIDMVPEVEKQFAGMAIKCDIQITENAARASSLASTAATLGYSRIIAVGGDGTCNSVAAGINNSDVIMGVIPAGRGNDFFRSLGISGDFGQICKIAAVGEPRSVDIGLLNERLFINSFGAGFVAAISLEANDNYAGGRRGYLKAIYRSWKKYIDYGITIRIDNLEMNLRATMIIASIGKTTGGGWPITPQASNNDGKFDVCVIENVNKSQIIPLMYKLWRAKHLRLPQVRMYRCRQLEISGDKDIPLHYDGEIYDNKGERLMIKCEQQSLRVASALESSDEN